MAILKKIKSASLMEALIATALIVIIFMMASLVLNNLLLNSFSKKTHDVETHISELEYYFNNNAFKLPYQEEYKNWNIEFKQEVIENITWLRISAINNISRKELVKAKIHAKE